MEQMWKDFSDRELLEIEADYGLSVSVVIRGILTNRKELEEELMTFEMNLVYGEVA